MCGIIDAVKHYFFPINDITLTKINTTIEDLESNVETPENQEKFIAEYSLLRKEIPFELPTDKSDFEMIRLLAISFQKDNLNTVIEARCSQFLEEFQHVDLFEKYEQEYLALQEIPEQHSNVEDLKEDHIKRLAERYEEFSKDKPLWIYMGPNVFVKLDLASGSLILFNNNQKEQKYNPGICGLYSSNVCDKSGDKRRKYTLYRFDPKKIPEDKSLFVALSRMAVQDEKIIYFQDRVLPYADLSYVPSYDYHFQERYEVQQENPLQSLLHYSVMGSFKGDIPEGAKEDTVFRKFIFYFQLYKIISEINKSVSPDILRELIGEMEILITQMDSLLRLGCLQEDELKCLKATYLDLLKRHEVCKHKSDIHKDNIQICREVGVLPEAPKHSPIISTSSRSISRIDPTIHGVKEGADEECFSPRSLGTIRALERVKGHRFEDNSNSELENIAEIFSDSADTFKIRFSLVLNSNNEIIEHKEDRSKISVEQQTEHTFVLKESFKKLIVLLPIPTDEPDNFWNTIDNPAAYLNTLDKLSASLHKLFEAYDEGIIFEGMILNYHILACIDHLCRKNTKAHLDSFKVYHYEYIKLLSNPQCVLDSPVVQEKAFKIAQYFDPSYQLHKIVSGAGWSWEECADSVQKSAFALLSVNVTNTFFKKTTTVKPLLWETGSNAGDCRDKMGQTYAYYKQFIDDKEINAVWAALGDAAPKTEGEKILWIAADSLKETSLLPMETAYLQRAVVRSIALNYISESSKYKNASIIPIILPFGDNQTLDYSKLHVQVDSPSSLEDIDTNIDLVKAEEWRKQQILFGFSNLQLEGKAPLWRMEKNLFKASGKAPLTAPSQNKIIKDPTLYPYIEHIQLWCNPFDSINRWINHLFRNNALLEDRNKRNEFFDALFQFGRLKLQLLCQPAFIHRLKAWMQNSLFFALSHGNYELVKDLCLNFAKLLKFINHLSVEGTELFTDMNTWLKKDVLPLCSTPKDRYWLHLNLLKIQISGGVLNKVEEFVISAAIVLFTKKYVSLEDQSGVREIAGRFQSMISIKHREFGLTIFKAVAEIYDLPIGTHVITTAKKISCGGYELNLDTFQVKLNGLPLCHRIPEQFLNLKAFKHYYGMELNRFIHEDYYKDYDVLLEDNYYVLVPKSKNDNLETYFIGFYPLTAKSTELVPVIEKVFEGKRYVLTNRNDLKHFTPDHLWFVEGQDTLWQEKKGLNILIEKAKGEKISIQCSKDVEKPVLLRPTEIIFNGRLLLSANQVSPNLVNLLKKFHRVPAIQFWCNPETKVLKSIKLPECNLSFTVDDQHRICCDQYHGYFLADALTPGKLPLDHSRSLILVNHNNQIKQLIIQHSQGSIICEYDYENYEEKNPVPKGTYSSLILIKDYVERGLYEEASTLISNLSGLFKLKYVETNLIGKILARLKKEGECPKASALVLKLSLYEYEQKSLHTNKPVDAEVLLNGYISFIAYRAECLDCDLTEREEKLLLDILITYYDDKLEQRIKPSIAAYWTYYIEGRRREHFKQRLACIEGKNSVTHIIPLLREGPQTTIPDIPVSSLIANLKELSKKLKKEIDDQKRLKIQWKQPQTIAEELEHLSLVFEIKRPISSSIPPSLTHLHTYFFIYYKFLCEDATEEERKNFAKALLLVNDTTGIIFTLRKVCLSPHGRISLASLLEIYRQSDHSGPSFWKWVGASCKGLELYMKMWGIVRFQWIRHTASHIFSSINKIYQFSTVYFKAYSQPNLIKDKCSFTFQAIDCSAIDQEFNEGNSAISKKYFEFIDGTYNELHQDSLNSACEDLETHIQKNNRFLNQELQRLVFLTNTPHGKGYMDELMRHVQRKHLDAKKLFTAFANATDSALMALTTYKDKAEFTKFLMCLNVHYQKINRIQQLERALLQLKNAQNAAGNVRVKLLQEACNILNSQPAYVRSTHIESRIKLAQEIQLGFFVNERQSKLLNDAMANADKGVIIKAPPGFGKSSFIRNAINLLTSLAGKTAVNIMPAMQEPTLARQLEEFMAPLGKRVVRTNISRDSEFSIQRLEQILRCLKDPGNVLNVSSPATYQWMEVHMKLHCHRLTKMNPSFIPPDELKKLQLYLCVLRELKVNSKAIFEEAQVVLKRENKVVASLVGNCNYNPRYAKISRQMMNSIMEMPQYAAIILANAQEQIPGDSEKMEEIKKHVAEHFFTRWKIAPEDKDKFIDFILIENNDQKFDEAFQWAKARMHDRDRLAYLKGILNVAFPQACKERINTIGGYCLSKLKPDLKVPIPCIQKENPSEHTKGPANYHPDVALMRAFFFYLASNLTLKDANQYIEQMYKNAETQANGNISLDNTLAGKEFKCLIRRLELSEDKYCLSSMQGRKKLEIAERMRNSVYAINLFVQNLVAPQIEFYNQTIESSTVNLQDMFDSTVALSANPPSKEAYGIDSVLLEDDMVQEEMEDLLLNKTSLDGQGGTARVQVLEALTSEAVLLECASKIASSRSAAIVEATPIFNKSVNAHLAATFGGFIEPFNTFEGVLFCDESDKQYKVYDIKSKTVQLLTSEHKQEQLFKLYTEAEAFNTDWFSIATGLFEVVIGPKTRWEDAAQAAGRARLSRILQSFSIVMQRELRNKFPENVTSNDIVKFLKRNTKLFIKLNTFISFKDQIDNTPHRFLLNTMMGLGKNRKLWKKECEALPNPLKALELFRSNQVAFIRRNSVEPWEMYSLFKTNRKPVDQLNGFIEQDLQLVNGLNGIGYWDRKHLRNDVDKFSQRLKGEAGAKIPLPESVDGFEDSINCHVEVLRIPQDERQVLKVKDIQFVRQEYQTDIYPTSIDKFISSGYRPSKLRHTIYNIVVYAKNHFSVLAYTTAQYIPFIFMGGFSIFAGSFLLANTVLATNIALASLIAMITAIGTNFIFYCATFSFHLAELAVTKVNVTYDTHYLRDVIGMNLSSQSKDVINAYANSNVMVTNNKFKLWTGNSDNTSQVPFMPDAKSLLQVMVIYHKQTGDFELIDIDAEDSRQIYEMLIEDNLNTSDEEAKNRSFQAAIYDVRAEFAALKTPPEACFVATTKGGINSKELLKHQVFHQEMDLLKLANGYTHFTEPQNQALIVLADRVGSDAVSNFKTLENFFVNEALLHRPERDTYVQLEVAKYLNPYAKMNAQRK
ncbi:MAG: hypothetical protein WC222_03645 [Parachlamydiales bacterium]|jgi:hypothetical protein